MDEGTKIDDAVWAQCLAALPIMERMKMLCATVELLGNSRAINDILESELHVLLEQTQQSLGLSE